MIGRRAPLSTPCVNFRAKLAVGGVRACRQAVYGIAIPDKLRLPAQFLAREGSRIDAIRARLRGRAPGCATHGIHGDRAPRERKPARRKELRHV